jgi:hypothetical protein
VKVLGFVIVAAVLVGGALFVLDRDPAPRRASHVAIAPAKSSPGVAGRVAGTTLSAQAAADAAIEDGRRPDLVPLSEHDFDRPIARYRTYAVGQARALQRAIARRDWVAASDAWLRAGAAYGALGSLGDEIAADLARLAARGDDDTAGAAAARRVASAARRLPAALRRAELEPLDYATRAHEILEDAQRDLFSPRETADGLAATKVVIGTLRPLLSGRGDVLPQVDSRLARLSQTLAGIHGEPTRVEREQLSGRLGAALEALAGVPGALETSLPPKIPVLK